MKDKNKIMASGVINNKGIDYLMLYAGKHYSKQQQGYFCTQANIILQKLHVWSSHEWVYGMFILLPRDWYQPMNGVW